MRDKDEPNSTIYTRLLEWLSPELSESERLLGEIRAGLVRLFITRQIRDPEDLADETIIRVAETFDRVAETYVGEKHKYFFGVAKNIELENARKTPPWDPLPDDFAASLLGGINETYEEYMSCLVLCLNRLPEEKKAFVLDYYSKNRIEKIERRKEIAHEKDINRRTLSVRAFRIRAKLFEWVEKCVRDGEIASRYEN